MRALHAATLRLALTALASASLNAQTAPSFPPGMSPPTDPHLLAVMQASEQIRQASARLCNQDLATIYDPTVVHY